MSRDLPCYQMTSVKNLKRSRRVQSVPELNEHISRWKHLLWAEIALGYLTDLYIFTQHTLMAVQCLDEVIDIIVKLYGIAVCAVFILMGDIVCPR